VRFVFLFSPVDQHLWESFKRYRKESSGAQISTQIAEADDKKKNTEESLADSFI
jgi:hypothetical protein